MRDVNAELGIPTREQLRERIARPERFRPEPRLVRTPPWRLRDDGYGELLVERTGEWTRIHPILVETHRGLEEGQPLDQILERALRRWDRPGKRTCWSFVRGHIYKLHKTGYVDIPFDAPPETYHDGRYERIKEIGRGGMGVIQLCRDRDRGGQEVVIKHAWGWSKTIASAEASVRREAAIHARFDHPGIPPLVETFEADGGLLHLVRAYAPGQPLTHHAKAISQADASIRRELGARLADVLAHVHERGFLYLDAKPDNFIMQSLDAVPQLLDMGICRPMDESGVAPLRSPVGSRGFAAPEVRKERVASRRSDVYGLGRVLFQVTTGVSAKHSWGADDMAKELEARGVDPAEQRIILRMCADDPALRHASLADVARELRELSEGR